MGVGVGSPPHPTPNHTILYHAKANQTNRRSMIGSMDTMNQMQNAMNERGEKLSQLGEKTQVTTIP